MQISLHGGLLFKTVSDPELRDLTLSFAPPGINMSMASNHSGATLSGACRNSTAPPKHTFELHLKETEFRFNHRHVALYKTLLTLLRKRPL